MIQKSQFIKRKANNINLKARYDRLSGKNKKSVFTGHPVYIHRYRTQK